MSDEIRRLGTLVGEFDYPFHPHSGFLQNYKKVDFISLSFFFLWNGNLPHECSSDHNLCFCEKVLDFNFPSSIKFFFVRNYMDI